MVCFRKGGCVITRIASLHRLQVGDPSWFKRKLFYPRFILASSNNRSMLLPVRGQRVTLNAAEAKK